MRRTSAGRPGAQPDDDRVAQLPTCGKCGTQLPGEANYCFRCGEPLRTERAVAATAQPAAGAECAIVWWRGYVEAGFFALPVGGTASSAEPIAASSFRRLRGGAPAPDGRDLAAYQEVVARLEAGGWEPAGSGLAWYETRFRRPVEPAVAVNGASVPRLAGRPPGPPPTPRRAAPAEPADPEPASGTRRERGAGRRARTAARAAQRKS